MHAQGAGFWSLAVARELDDLILDLRTNEPALGTWVLRTTGDAERVLAYDQLLADYQDDWLANEIVLYLKRTFKRLDVTSRSPDRPDRARVAASPGRCWSWPWPPTAPTSCSGRERPRIQKPIRPRSRSAR